jgi:hypothetical protein
MYGGIYMALENLGIKRSSVVNYVFRLLTRSRITLEQVTGEVFVGYLPQLRVMRFTGLVLVEMQGGIIGRLLFQNGRLVFASQGDLESTDALRLIQRSVGGSTFIIFPLDQAQANLAFAAVDGIPQGVGMQIPVGGEALFIEQKRRGFTGMLALESGSSLLVWQFVGGNIQFGPEVPSDLERFRVVHITWNPHELPELLLTTGEPNPLGLGMTPNYAPQPFQTAYPAQPMAQYGQPMPPVPQYPQTAPQYPPTSAQPATSNDINMEIWRTFQDVLKKHLADRAPRVFNLMRQEHALETSGTLVNNLAAQLDRVAGSAVAQAFRARFGQ